MKTTYQMVISNIARSIIDNGPESKDPAPDAFQASEVIAIAFCKSKQQVIMDIMQEPRRKKTI